MAQPQLQPSPVASSPNPTPRRTGVAPLPAARRARGAAERGPAAAAPKGRRPRPAAPRAAATPPCCPSEPGSGRANWLASAQCRGELARLRRSAAAHARNQASPTPPPPTRRRRSLGELAAPPDLPSPWRCPKGKVKSWRLPWQSEGSCWGNRPYSYLGRQENRQEKWTQWSEMRVWSSSLFLGEEMDFSLFIR